MGKRTPKVGDRCQGKGHFTGRKLEGTRKPDGLFTGKKYIRTDDGKQHSASKLW